jgi:hypothetical protein
MKILIIQEKGRHFKNQNFRESENIKRSLNKLGIDNIVWGLSHDNFNISFDEISKDCDVIFLLENYEVNGWIPDLSKINKLKIFWSIDSHCALEQHIYTASKHKINIVLCSNIDDIDNFPVKSYWFPNAYPDDLIHPKENIEKTIDIGFCGNILNRTDWLENISKYFNLKTDIFVIGDDMVNVINSYKIHFNKNLSYDINFRTFETLGCKTLLMTNYTNGLEKLFDLDNDLVLYKSFEDLKEKIDYYLNNESERLRISENGFNKVKKEHTYFKRTEQLIEIIKENL